MRSAFNSANVSRQSLYFFAAKYLLIKWVNTLIIILRYDLSLDEDIAFFINKETWVLLNFSYEIAYS